MVRARKFTQPGSSVLLSEQPGSEDRFGSVTVMVFAFVIMEDPKAACEAQ
jgi:hypothetical protein